MPRVVQPGVVRAERWWTRLPDGRVECRLCPRRCRLRPGQRGFCYVRAAGADGMELRAYGRTSGLAVDPVEKKPLFHVHPGRTLLSFGTIGCNLGCRYCQNWRISRSRDEGALDAPAPPERVASLAVRARCVGVAFTYNDPVVFAEYAVDCAEAAHRRGLASVAVTAGYLSEEAREPFLGAMDAVNVDLKSIDDAFYRRLCLGSVGPVLDTLRWLHARPSVWLELTNLLIPGFNDGETRVAQLVDWVLENLGPDVPLHFTAFRPAHRMLDTPPTPAATLRRARRQARDAGVRFAYTGNVRDLEGGLTRCPGCGAELIRRDGYRVTFRELVGDGACGRCGRAVPGRFGPQASSFSSAPT